MENVDTAVLTGCAVHNNLRITFNHDMTSNDDDFQNKGMEVLFQYKQHQIE
jgi:hypothetical protein